MGLFDRFKRDDDSVLPSEVETYYHEEKSGRRTAALMLGLVTFVITLLVGTLLFFGGRAIYRAISDDKPNDQVAQPEKQPETKPAATTATSNESSESTSNSTETSTPPSEDSEDTPNNNPSRRPKQIVNTGDQDSLPRTGDPGQ